MVGHCTQCGKNFDILFPDLWRYKKGKRLFCSWHCLRADERKEEDEMARLKKDGTWPRDVCNYIVSGRCVKFFRIDFLRKGGWI